MTWATATLVIVYLLTTGISSVIQRTSGLLGSSISALTQTAQSLTPDSLSVLPDGLEAQARALLQRGEAQVDQAGANLQQQGQQAATNVQNAAGTQDMSAAISKIVAGLKQDASPEDRDAAVTLISQQAGIPKPEAEQRLTDFQDTYDQAVATAKKAATQAAKTVSTTSLATFGALLAGVVVAALGGLAGRPRYRVTTTYA